MEQNINNTNNPAGADPFFDEMQSRSKFSFDFVLWFYRLLKYWYLFVISLALCIGYAYVLNQSWVPYFQTEAVLMMESRGNIGVGNNAVPLGNMVKSSVNQNIILQSYDLTVRTVESLPQMQVAYFRPGKFTPENLYKRTPVTIECQYISPSAYSESFTLAPIDDKHCRIYYDATETKPAFSMDVPYGQFVQDTRFYIKVVKTDRFTAKFSPFNFRFVSKDELVNRYRDQIYTRSKGEGSSAMTVGLVGACQLQDQDYLSALLVEYEKYNLSLKNQAVDRAIEFLEKQLILIRDSLSVSESAFKDFQERTGIYEVQNTNVRKELNQISQNMSEIKHKDLLVREATGLMNKAIAEDIELPDPSSFGLTNTALSKQIADHNALLANIKKVGSSYPRYEEFKRSLRDMKINILKELQRLQTQVQSESEGLQQASNNLQGQIDVLPAQEREYIRYENKYNMNENYHTYLRQKIIEAKFQQASQIADNYILEAPRQASGVINGDERSQRYTFYLLIGFAIPLLFVVCKEEFFNYTIATKEDCERIANLPVIGAIENVSKKVNKGLAIVKNYPKSSFAESFRNMRVRIEYMAQKESGIKLLITSAEPGDGKTFVAINVASIYQLTGKRVVLVDFDLRRPAVAGQLDIANKKGVSNYLIGQVSLDEIIITHPDYGFDVIPAGTLPPNPSELIKTKKTSDLIQHLNAKYDYVVVDCSPVGLVSDAYILSRLVDTTLFVVRRAKTNKAFFRSVVAQIKNDGLTNIGLVFNDVKGREGYYGTSRYYGDKTYYLKKNSYYHDDYFEK